MANDTPGQTLVQPKRYDSFEKTAEREILSAAATAGAAAPNQNVPLHQIACGSAGKEDEPLLEKKVRCTGDDADRDDSLPAQGSFRRDGEEWAACKQEQLTYFRFLQNNGKFRLYLASYITNHMGEWMTYLASIAAIEEIQIARGSAVTSQLAISLLIVIRLSPTVLLSPFGGALADRYDRRKSMIFLDILGAIVAMLFVISVKYQSIGMLYVATWIQACVGGIYEPSRSAIIPLLVQNEEELQKATTLSGISWSFIAAFGSATGGFLVTWLGMRGCFCEFCVDRCAVILPIR